MTPLSQSIDEAQRGTFDLFVYAYEVEAALLAIWPPLLAPSRSRHVDTDRTEHLQPDFDVSFSLAEPEPTSWSIAFTPTFRKSLGGVDRKLQGRVLVAISELSEMPNTVHGDTVKPLVGEFKGLWRYRVGDYRLVYEPNQERRLVVLLEFAARGGVYEQ